MRSTVRFVNFALAVLSGIALLPCDANASLLPSFAMPSVINSLSSRGLAGGLGNLAALYDAVKDYLKDQNAYVSPMMNPGDSADRVD